jgi:hypothetical protein
MIAQHELTQLKARIDCRDLAPSLSGKGRELVGPCPRCGGEDRFHVQADRWFCRQCAPPEAGKGKKDCFDLVQFLGHAHDFKGAIEYLRSWTGERPSADHRKPQPDKNKIDWRGERWQQAAWKEVINCQKLLQRAENASGLAYLTERGFTAETIEAYQLGFRPDAWHSGRHCKLPAISIPRFDESGEQITTIQRRFIDPGLGKDEQRYGRFLYPRDKTGSTGDYNALLFPPVHRSNVLVIVEGEFNAMSIWQATSYDVASFGSKSLSNQMLTTLATLAARYQQVIIWADEPDDAKKIQQVIPAGVPMKSPKGLDANDLLRSGQLAGLLALKVTPPVAADAKAATVEPVAEIITGPVASVESDIIDFVGATVDGATWQALQQKLQQPEYEGWTLNAQPEGDGWHIHRLHLLPVHSLDTTESQNPQGRTAESGAMSATQAMHVFGL